ncbi:MAG TPA: hypothetical protein VNC50_02785 [Planctomycetia bacterium]|nr:hypothetical protein [Planctomycetia bacterium]
MKARRDGWRAILQPLVMTAVLASATGCSLIPLGPWGGPAYQLDESGSGGPEIKPRNDHQYWNGEPMDYRSLK